MHKIILIPNFWSWHPLSLKRNFVLETKLMYLLTQITEDIGLTYLTLVSTWLLQPRGDPEKLLSNVIVLLHVASATSWWFWKTFKQCYSLIAKLFISTMLNVNWLTFSTNVKSEDTWRNSRRVDNFKIKQKSR